MPREHATITLTDDEVVQFLGGQSQCVVATLDDDGSPWGDVAACTYRDGQLYFWVPAGTRTLRNLQSDARVCCTLESKGDDYYSIKAAMVHGTASAVASNDRAVAELETRVDPVTRTVLPGAVFSVGLDNVVSFDFGKIKRRFEQA